MTHQYCVYILTNSRHTVIYTGVANDLARRMFEYREKQTSSFTSRYRVSKLVYYEAFEDVTAGIAREKQIKAGSCAKKIALINGMNPDRRDLYPQLL